MPNSQNGGAQSWSDPRYLLTTFIMPFGFLVWVGGTLFIVTFPFFQVRKLELGEIIVSVIVFLVGFYYTIAGFQIFFLELRERFIAHKITYVDGMFLLKGYYFKEATFHASEVKKVEPIMISERIFQKRLGTLLSRSTRFTIPYGKNVNLKITLHDNRVFYLPGEMGRPGLWKTEDVKELCVFMEACVAPMPTATSRTSITTP